LVLTLARSKISYNKVMGDNFALIMGDYGEIIHNKEEQNLEA
jgi:hypothetical protein